MNKYLLLYMSPISAEEQMQTANPEDGQKAMDMWMAWFNKQGSAIVDHGEAAIRGMNYTASASSALHAPYVGGYSVVQAESLDNVRKMLEGHPHFMLPGGSIEVHELMSMM